MGEAQLTSEPPHRPASHHRRPGRHQTLEIEVIAGGNPIRFARILATLVNNSPMALSHVSVGDHSAYPVPSSSAARRGPMSIALHLRDRSQRLDGLLVAEMVEIVSTMCQVVEWRRRP